MDESGGKVNEKREKWVYEKGITWLQTEGGKGLRSVSENDCKCLRGATFSTFRTICELGQNH